MNVKNALLPLGAVLAALVGTWKLHDVYVASPARENAARFAALEFELRELRQALALRAQSDGLGTQPWTRNDQRGFEIKLRALGVEVPISPAAAPK